MEQIDDDCAKRGIQFVKVNEEGAAEQYGVARLPSLVFFKNDLPSLYEGNPFFLYFTYCVEITRLSKSLNIYVNKRITSVRVWDSFLGECRFIHTDKQTLTLVDSLGPFRPL